METVGNTKLVPKVHGVTRTLLLINFISGVIAFLGVMLLALVAHLQNRAFGPVERPGTWVSIPLLFLLCVASVVGILRNRIWTPWPMLIISLGEIGLAIGRGIEGVPGSPKLVPIVISILILFHLLRRWKDYGKVIPVNK